MTKDVAIIGMGFAGLTLGIHFVRRGYKVLGVEKNPTVIDALRKAEPTFFEPGIDGYLKQAISSKMLEIYDSKVPTADVFVVTVGTPIDSESNIITSFIQVASEQVAEVLKEGDIVIIRSTVRVGITRNLIKPILDRKGVNYHLGFCPERTLEGNAFEELSSLPQIISGINESDITEIRNIFLSLCDDIVEASSIEAAEIAKLFSNTERDMIFSISNSFARISQSMNVNFSEVREICNDKYPRSNLAKPGPVGGPCLSKDPYILANSMSNRNSAVDMVLAARRNNEECTHSCLSTVQKWDQETRNKLTKISVLGLAFKANPPTSDIRGSLAIPLISELSHEYPKAEIWGHDELVSKEHALSIKGLRKFGNLEDVLDRADVIVVHTSSLAYSQICNFLHNNQIKSLVFDYWWNVVPPVTDDFVKLVKFGDSY